MKANMYTRCFASKTSFVLAIAFAAASQAYAQQDASSKAAPVTRAAAGTSVTESQARARVILMQMAGFVAETQRFSVSLREGYDAVQKSGQKLEFGESRKVTLSRPDRLRVESERSDGVKTLALFSGKQITVIDSTRNVYAAAPQNGGLDDSIVYFVRDLGMRLPLAMLLVSRLPAELEERVRAVDYVEKTSIHGASSHHLAVRGDTVDFQVWIGADGDKPLPQRIVLTYKKAPGQPQYWASFSQWNLAPEIAEGMFAAEAPDGAQQVGFAAPRQPSSRASRKRPADKGPKS